MKQWNLPSGILVSIAGLAAAMQTAYAEQPPDVVASDAHGNTASGYGSLHSIDAVSAVYNSAFGYVALGNDSTAFSGTAIGYFPLASNTTGLDNIAVGITPLTSNTTGMRNIAIGSCALCSNTTGSENTAIGHNTLVHSVGDSNTTAGPYSLFNDTTGANNTAFGLDALYWNTTGKGNEAQGVFALFSNTTGIRNLAVGSNALYRNISGSYNVAFGFNAGINETTGNDNIYIANSGAADESQTLRLGSQGTAGVEGSGIVSAYVAGVASSQVTGSAVYITPSGQLGVLASSERFKTDIETLAAASEKLAQLRPVTFKLATDSQGTRQYGLIAEEVAKVYPELVIHGADGRIDGVRYEELAPMLLSGVQQQQAQLLAQAKTAAAQAEAIRKLQSQARKINSRAGMIHDLQIQARRADAQAEAIRSLEAQVAQMNEFKQSMMTTLREKHPRLLARAR